MVIAVGMNSDTGKKIFLKLLANKMTNSRQSREYAMYVQHAEQITL